MLQTILNILRNLRQNAETLLEVVREARLAMDDPNVTELVDELDALLNSESPEPQSPETP